MQMPNTSSTQSKHPSPKRYFRPFLYPGFPLLSLTWFHEWKNRWWTVSLPDLSAPSESCPSKGSAPGLNLVVPPTNRFDCLMIYLVNISKPWSFAQLSQLMPFPHEQRDSLLRRHLAHHHQRHHSAQELLASSQYLVAKLVVKHLQLKIRKYTCNKITMELGLQISSTSRCEISSKPKQTL